MSQLKTSFARFVVVALLAPGMLAACAEVSSGERGANSAQDAHSSMPARIDRPAPHAR